MPSTCVIGAMTGELEKIIEIYKGEKGAPEEKYVAIVFDSQGNCVFSEVDKNRVSEVHHSFTGLENYSDSFWYQAKSGFAVPVYRILKFGDNHYVVHTNVREKAIPIALALPKMFGSANYINVGLSGALKSEEKLGDMITPSHSQLAIFGDKELSISKRIELKKVGNLEGIVGTELTSNVFFDSDEKSIFADKDYAGVDMETYYFALSLKGNISIVRVISDELSHGGKFFFNNIGEIFKIYNEKIEGIKSVLL